MPALRLFGRKWLAASDDLVYPGLFEVGLRGAWLALMGCVCGRVWPRTFACAQGGAYVRAYLAGVLTLLSANVLLLAALVNRSAQGAVTDVHARRHVAPLLLAKLALLPPELALNVLGTVWAFCPELIRCRHDEHFSTATVEALVIFDWVLFGLTVFGLALVFDPVGSRRYHEPQETPGESMRQQKATSLWLRRMRWAFCWVRSDEHGREAFQQVAGLLGALFRSTDLVPSDVVTGCVLLRVKQKRETREMRRIRMLSGAADAPRYSADVRRVFGVAPRWMSLEKARHYLRLSIAAYGWPFVLYRHCVTGAFRLAPHLSCCTSPSTTVADDNCCLCHLAAVRHTAHLRPHDVLYASFRNHVFELPFCLIAHHETSSVVLAIRGSISLRDVLTDLTAASERFDADGMPPETMAHRGMIAGARYVRSRLAATGVLEHALARHPDYDLVLTGHSLGAGVAVLLAIMLRPMHPDLKVYAFSTPAGLITREAARITESFVLTIGVGDDFVMRLGVDSIENLRTGIIQTLRATRLPKYRILLNGFGYALFGVPPRDLETTWRDADHDVDNNDDGNGTQRPPIDIVHIEEAALLARDVSVRRFSRARLYNAGRILHIARRKRDSSAAPEFHMRWASPEDFTELRVMPRMLLDHLPENVYATLETIIDRAANNNNNNNNNETPTPGTSTPNNV